jgi:IS5 family transposase
MCVCFHSVFVLVCVQVAALRWADTRPRSLTNYGENNKLKMRPRSKGLYSQRERERERDLTFNNNNAAQFLSK